PDLALRTLKEIKNLNPTLATQVLQLKSERLQDRKQVFVQLSQKLGSPDQVVDVLRAYHESIGPDIPRADLYFMMETLQRYDVSIAKDLLHDLLGYLPEVPKGLIDFIDLESEFAPYWCEVPSGSFIIGAAPNDHDRPPWVPVWTEVYISSFLI